MKANERSSVPKRRLALESPQTVCSCGIAATEGDSEGHRKGTEAIPPMPRALYPCGSPNLRGTGRGTEGSTEGRGRADRRPRGPAPQPPFPAQLGKPARAPWPATATSGQTPAVSCLDSAPRSFSALMAMETRILWATLRPPFGSLKSPSVRQNERSTVPKRKIAPKWLKPFIHAGFARHRRGSHRATRLRAPSPEELGSTSRFAAPPGAVGAPWGAIDGSMSVSRPGKPARARPRAQECARRLATGRQQRSASAVAIGALTGQPRACSATLRPPLGVSRVRGAYLIPLWVLSPARRTRTAAPDRAPWVAGETWPWQRARGFGA